MLQNEKLILRGLEYEDLELIHLWMNDFELLRNLLRIEPSIRFFTEKWFEQVHADKSKKIMAIEDTVTRKFIGCIGVNNIDYINRKAELYIYIGDYDFRGKGYAKSALGLFLKYLFNYYNLNRIYLQVRADNTTAVNLYRQAGFSEEGKLRQDRYIDGQYADVLLMSILKGDMRD